MLTDEELSENVRARLHDLADVGSPKPDVASLTIRRARQRRRRRVTTALVVIAVAALTSGGVISRSEPGASPGVTLKLASYSFQMPPGSKFATPTSSYCIPVLIDREPDPIYPPDVRPRAVSTPNGGCVTIAASNTYVPSRSLPDAFRLHRAKSLTIDGHRGWVAEGVGPFKSRGLDEEVVGVQTTTDTGAFEDLIAGATGVSTAELVRILGQGLSSSSR